MGKKVRKLAALIHHIELNLVDVHVRVGGAEVLKRYMKINQSTGNSPAPTALGTGGLAEARKFTKEGDDSEYYLYGDGEIAGNPTVDTQPAYGGISQADGYVTWYDNGFFAGKALTKLIRRGDKDARNKGNVAQISFQVLSATEGHADGEQMGAPLAVSKGSKVKQMQTSRTGVPIVGKLWRPVVVGDTDLWVELQECEDLSTDSTTVTALNGGGVSQKTRFKASRRKKDRMLTIGEGASFEAKVTDIKVFCAVVPGVDPRLSPVMPVPDGCSPFLTLTNDLRSAIHSLACLKRAYAWIRAGDHDTEQCNVSLTVALPKDKLAVKDFDLDRHKDSFKHDAKCTKFHNLQCKVLVFKGVTIDEQVTQAVTDTYKKCFTETNSNGCFLPVLASEAMKKAQQKGAGALAQDALRSLSPAVNAVLSQKPSETMMTNQKRKGLEQSLGWIGKVSKKSKSGKDGTDKRGAANDLNALLYAAQDMLMLGDWSAEQLRTLLRRACAYEAKRSNRTLKVKSNIDETDDVNRLSLALQLVWFKRPIDDRVACDIEVFEVTDDGYDSDELRLTG